MKRFRALALAQITILVTATTSTPLYAQVASTSAQTPSISLSLAMEQTLVPAEQKPWALLTIKNISRQVIEIPPWLHFLMHVRIQGKDQGPPETEFQRHLHGDYRPGDGPALDIGPAVAYEMTIGASEVDRDDLTRYYDLSKPGKYIVYIELQDPIASVNGTSTWVRSNAVQFEIVPPGTVR